MADIEIRKEDSVFSQISEELLSCQICFEPYTQPKVLPCLHSFCLHCLVQYTSQESKTIPCPICRAEALLPDNGVESLKDNFFILNLYDAYTMLSRTDGTEPRKAQCTVCTDGPASEATSRCLECVDFLCDSCAVSHDHRITRFSPRHRMVSISLDSEKEKEVLKKEALCHKHGSEPMRYFCETCESSICRDCVLIEHKDHSHTYLKDKVIRYQNATNVLQVGVKEKMSAFQEAIDNVEEIEFKLEANRGEAEYLISRATEEFVEIIKQQEAVLLNKLSSICNSRKKQLTAHKESLRQGLENLTSGFEFSQKALQHGNDVEIISLREQVLDRLQGLSTISPQQDMTIEKLSELYFVASESPVVAGAAEASSPYSLGEIKYGSKRENAGEKGAGSGEGSEVTSLCSSVQASPMHRKLAGAESTVPETSVGGGGAENLKPKHVFNLNDTTEQGGEFDWPSGVAVTNDGDYIVVSDRDNDRVQIFDKEGKFECKFGSRGRRKGQFELPLDIALMEEETESFVYVTDEYNHRVQKFTLYGKYVSHFGDNGLFKQPYGIATEIGNQRLVVTDIGKHRLTIHDPMGQVLHSFGGHGDTDERFNEPRYVAISRDRIVVSDHCNHCIKVFDFEGRHTNTFGSCGSGRGQFIGPTGVCLDSQGQIVVADCADRVQLFSRDGVFIRHLLSELDGISGPLGMAITTNGNQPNNLVITNLGTHRVNVFKYPCS